MARVGPTKTALGESGLDCHNIAGFSCRPLFCGLTCLLGSGSSMKLYSGILFNGYIRIPSRRGPGSILKAHDGPWTYAGFWRESISGPPFPKILFRNLTKSEDMAHPTCTVPITVLLVWWTVDSDAGFVFRSACAVHTPPNSPRITSCACFSAVKYPLALSDTSMLGQAVALHCVQRRKLNRPQ